MVKIYNTELNIGLTQLRLYLDTADIAEWHNLMPTGIFYGITTNPLLTKRAGLLYEKICWENLSSTAAELGAKEIHVQVHGDIDTSLKFCENLYAIGQSVGIECVVKIPLSLDGIAIVAEVKSMGGKILLTACCDAKQMIIASALEVDYVATYFGRMMDAGVDVMAHMRAIKVMSKNGSCRPMVASIRNTQQMVEIAALGHDCFTISPAVAHDLFQNNLTESAVSSFKAAVTGELF